MHLDTVRRRLVCRLFFKFWMFDRVGSIPMCMRDLVWTCEKTCCAPALWRNGRHQKPSKPRRLRLDLDLLEYCLDKLLLQIIIQGMATRIRCSRLTRLCGSGVTELSAARKHRVPTRSFSSTRILAQDTETALTHGFSNGRNLGSIALKKNSIYLENKLRIVRRHRPKIHYYSLLIRQSDAFPGTRGQGTSR
jgi:hypothetical protein